MCTPSWPSSASTPTPPGRRVTSPTRARPQLHLARILRRPSRRLGVGDERSVGDVLEREVPREVVSDALDLTAHRRPSPRERQSPNRSVSARLSRSPRVGVREQPIEPHAELGGQRPGGPGLGRHGLSVARRLDPRRAVCVWATRQATPVVVHESRDSASVRSAISPARSFPARSTYSSSTPLTVALCMGPPCSPRGFVVGNPIGLSKTITAATSTVTARWRLDLVRWLCDRWRPTTDAVGEGSSSSEHGIRQRAAIGARPSSSSEGGRENGLAAPAEVCRSSPTSLMRRGIST